MNTAVTKKSSGRNGQPLIPINTSWNFSSDGIGLSAGLWWVAYLAPSERNAGQWWWKTTACGESIEFQAPRGYAATAEEALVAIRKSLQEDRLYAYTLPDDTIAIELLHELTQAH